MDKQKMEWSYLDSIAKRLKELEDRVETLDWALKHEHERIDNIEEYLEAET